MKIAYLVILILCSPVSGQISDTDLDQMAAYYKDHRLGGMPPPMVDPAFRKSIHDRLPRYITSRIIEDPGLVSAVRDLLKPVIMDRPYDLMIFDSPTPIAMSDSGVILAISTALLERASSDDELLGYASHEVAHEYFASYSIYSKHLLKLIGQNGKEPFLASHAVQILELIELQCDAFAALTLQQLGYDPLAFIEGLELTERDFPKHRIGNHPPNAQRRKLVQLLTTDRVKSRRDSGVKVIRKLLRAEARTSPLMPACLSPCPGEIPCQF